MKNLILAASAIALLSACQGKRGHDGAPGAQGPAGINGSDGAVGPQGPQGAQGPAGSDGADGEDAPPTPYTPVALINPCGDAPGIADEVFILLANGQLIASFSQSANGDNTRFAVLSPGNYVTTDGDNCSFTLSSDGSITNESKSY